MQSLNRKKTRKIRCGDLFIGGGASVKVQSMTTTDTRDIVKTVEQIKQLEIHGCEIVRVAIVDQEAALALKEIKKAIHIPLVADIHFDYRLAIESIKNGADKIRINPGNIGTSERLKKVIDVAKAYGVPIRIGVNSGSIEKEILEKYNTVTAEAMIESTMKHVRLLEAFDFHDIIISLKSSDVKLTYDAYTAIAKLVDYPLHLGVTEAGSLKTGKVKSSIGIGSLLLNGIGDTIRVSLTGDPVEEVKHGRLILKSLGLIDTGVNIISCPTCGRCNVDLINLVEVVEQELEKIQKNITVAIMGCAVNGPGEAREADIGIAGGDSKFLLFKKGEIIKSVDEKDILKVLLDEINSL